MGVDVLGPDVNESQYKFSVNEKGQIRFGLGAIKGIGEGPSEAINKEREHGKYKNIYDFFERVSGMQINKRVVESLVRAGAFDELDTYHRAQYFAMDDKGRTNIEKLIRYGQSFKENKNSVENSLFADFASEVHQRRTARHNSILHYLKAALVVCLRRRNGIPRYSNRLSFFDSWRIAFSMERVQ